MKWIVEQMQVLDSEKKKCFWGIFGTFLHFPHRYTQHHFAPSSIPSRNIFSKVLL